MTSEAGINKPVEKNNIISEDSIQVFFFLVSSENDPKLQLRFLSRLMDLVEQENFTRNILSFSNERELKEYLLQHDRHLTLYLAKTSPSAVLIGKRVVETMVPDDVLIALIQRENQILTPRGNTILQENDIVTIIGEPASIKKLFRQYVHHEKDKT